MRINTKGHMVFGSDREAIAYASNAGFSMKVEVGTGATRASRPDIASQFTLQKLSKGNNRYEWMWYRPYADIAYS